MLKTAAITPTRVLIADANAMFRSGVRSILASESGFQVAEAGDLTELLRAVEPPCPTIILLDADLPPFGATIAVSRVRQRCTSEVVVWGFHPSQRQILEVIRAGGSGYLSKDISPHALVRALRGASEGEALISRDLATALIEGIHALDESESVRDRAALLSDREREVIAFVTRGLRNKEIATALSISELTVKRHVQNILQKLDVSSRQAAGQLYLEVLGADRAGTRLEGEAAR
ncbi:MAG: response regulator transcription factor [Actinomycetota bacterium]